VRASIDAANVYPVADSDTGTNLVMTFEAVARALEKTGDDPVAVSHAVRSGALTGARGNSGVIMAQVLHGWADAVEGGGADVEQVARAFKRATELAYEAVLAPAEGTILTVATAASGAAQGAHETVTDQFVSASKAAAEALSHTPEQLPLLAQAGVVDAGGMGLVVVLEAFARALGGDVGHPAPEQMGDEAPAPIRDTMSSRYAYEVQYLLRAPAGIAEPLRKLLAEIGDSVAVIGGEGLWRAHVHTNDKDRAVSLGGAFGEVSDVEVQSFAEQIEARNKESEARQEAAAGSAGVRGIPLAHGDRPAALVAVVSGAGVERLFHELGAATVDGAARGSVTDDALLQMIEQADMDDVILLPNNTDVFWRALELKGRTKRRLRIVNTSDIGEGLAAAVAYGDARDVDAAVRDMERAVERVRTGMVVIAPQPGESPAGPIQAGQAVGIADGSIVDVDDDPVKVAAGVAGALLGEERELLTILCADDVAPDERARLQHALDATTEGITIEIHDGGQPIHRYVLAAE
jgi:DAK2 domain fusion protein YloV